MENFESVQDFFCKMHCSSCDSNFKPEGITLLKEESGFFIIKIICTECNQSVGIALVGIKERPIIDLDDSFLFPDKQDQSSFAAKELAPINYDDVINAHDFFSNLGHDWMKHITPPENNDIDYLSDEE